MGRQVEAVEETMTRPQEDGHGGRTSRDVPGHVRRLHACRPRAANTRRMGGCSGQPYRRTHSRILSAAFLGKSGFLP